MKRFFLFIFLVVVLSLGLFLPVRVLADFNTTNSAQSGCTQTVIDPGTGKTFNDVPSLPCLAQIVVNVINIALSVLGGVTLLFLLVSAVRFVISGGDPKAIEGAKKMMTYAIIGAVVVLSSMIILNVVATTLGFAGILSSFSLYKP